MAKTPTFTAEHFNKLPPIERALLIFAALWVQGLMQTKSILLLASRKIKTPDNKRADALAVKNACAKLVKAQLLQASPDGYRVNPLHHADVIVYTQAAEPLAPWLDALREVFAYEFQYDYRQKSAVFAWRAQLWAALAGDETNCARWGEIYAAYPDSQGPVAQYLMASAAGPALFGSFKPSIQGMLLSANLNVVNLRLDECEQLYRFTLNHLADVHLPPETLQALSLQALLRGDQENSQRLLAQTPPAYQRSALAALAVMRGEFAEACAQYAHIIAHEKANSAKRKNYLNHFDSLFFTLAGIGENTAASLKAVKALVANGVKNRESYAYYVLQPLLNHLVNGQPLGQFGLYSPHNRFNLDTLFELIALTWVDASFTKGWEDFIAAVQQACAQRGYAWVANELGCLLSKVGKRAAANARWHTERALKPLINARAHEEPWQRALLALGAINSPSTPVQTNPQRIVWHLKIYGGSVDLCPLEQKCSAKGLWSKGRPIALRRLHNEPDAFDSLTEQDKQVISCIQREHSYYGSSYELDADKALPMLINHPFVFWADAVDVRVDIVAGEVALQLSQKGQSITLTLDPPISSSETVAWIKQTPTRIAVYTRTAEIKQIASIIGAGLTVPVEAKEQLVSVIKAISPHLAIHSNVPELSSQMASVPADTRLYAHLLPLNSGLRLQFLQRPLPDGSWFPPGRGAVNVVGEVDSATVQATRNLKDEKKRLEQVLEACPSLADASLLEGEQEWQIDHPETCLELLSELKALPETTLQLVWPQGERMRLKGNRSLGQMRLSIKKQGEWFEADGDVSLDDGRVIALRELLLLTSASNTRFLHLGDNDYLALTTSLRKRLQELNAYAEGNAKGGLRINPLAAPALAELAAQVGELDADQAWLDQVKKFDGLADFKPTLPSTLQAQLRDYQLQGYQWLARLAHWGVGACLADDMGLGKTVQTLALLLNRAPKGPALVIAPLSVAMNWLSETQKFAPTLKTRLYNSNRDLSDLGTFDLVIASYGLVQQDIDLFTQQHWHSLVLDEAQAIKNSATKRSQAVMSLKADFKVIASGTPVENHLGELWNLFHFINPGLLGSKERFAKRFATPIENGDDTARQTLKKMIQPFILRRSKSQVLSELPARTQITLPIELSAQERHLYEALRQQAVDNIAAAKKNTPMQVLAEITKLRRFCCNPQLVLKNADTASSKLAVFAKVLEELLDNKHKALVFSQFVDHLSIVRDYLDQQGISYQYLDGATPTAERKKRVDLFQAGEGDVFLISLKAGGTGLNLTAADYVIHLDPWWNPAVEDQASDRAHRMGQQRPVTIYRLVAQNTIEEKIISLHAEKRDLADSLLDEGDVAGRLDTAALLALLKESH